MSVELEAVPSVSSRREGTAQPGVLDQLLAQASKRYEEANRNTEPKAGDNPDPKLTAALGGSTRHAIALLVVQAWREGPGKGAAVYTQARDQLDAFVLAQVITWIETRLEWTVRTTSRRRCRTRR